jgi:hypothetical protein
VPILHFAPAWLVLACAGAALVLTLVLAAFLTPRHWWRRANARALAVLAVGTALFTALFLLGAQSWLPRPAPMPLPLARPAPLPIAIHTYRVFDDLNLRAAIGTGAARIAVVPGGTLVTTTGRVDGDWWEVTASVDGRAVTGWASSLWLRRDDERRVR